MTSEQIHKMCALQHKLFILSLLLKQAPMSYLIDDMDKLMKDILMKDKFDKYTEELNKLIDEVGSDIVKSTFSNKELLQQPENRFTLEEQKQASKEVIGKAITFEDFIEEYQAKYG